MDTFGIVYVSIAVVLSIVVTITNAFVLVVINRTSKRLRTIPYRFISSLAAADMLVGVIGIPSATSVNFGRPYGDYDGCTILNTANLVVTGISVFCIVAIATERFIAIKHPYSYHSGYFGQNPTTVITMTWIVGILCNMVPVFGWRIPPPDKPEACAFVKTIDLAYMVYIRFFVCHLIPMIIIPAMYGYIFFIIRKRAKSLSELDVHCVQKERERRQVRRERRAARAVVALFVVFLICVLPIDIMDALSVLAEKQWDPKTQIPPAVFLSHLNSAVNPFIYAFTNKHVRKSTKRLLGDVQIDFITETLDTSEEWPIRNAYDVSANGAESTNHGTTLVSHFSGK